MLNKRSDDENKNTKSENPELKKVKYTMKEPEVIDKNQDDSIEEFKGKDQPQGIIIILLIFLNIKK